MEKYCLPRLSTASSGPAFGRIVVAAHLAAALAACSGIRSIDPDGGAPPKSPVPVVIAGAYSMSASVAVLTGTESQVRFSVQVKNLSATSIRLDYGGCWSFFRFFTSSSNQTAPVLDESTLGEACSVAYHQLVLAPGDTGSLTRTYPVSSLIDLGLSPGTYYVGLEVAPNDSLRQVQAGAIEIQR